MKAIIAHSDADGIISAALIHKLEGDTSIYFSSHHYLIKTLCNLLLKDYISLKILDISPTKKSLAVASAFEEVVWIDHHETNLQEVPKNIKLINKKFASTAQLIASTFNIKDKLVEIANEIDTNSVKSAEALFFRNLISAIKWKFRKQQLLKFRQIVKILTFRDFSELEKNESFTKVIEEYNKWLEENINKPLSTLKTYTIENKKIAIVEGLPGIPVYEIYNRLSLLQEFDILVVFFRKFDIINKRIITKVEFRGKEEKVIEMAKAFNGGGHENAAGCTVNYYLTANEVIKKIEEILKK